MLQKLQSFYKENQVWIAGLIGAMIMSLQQCLANGPIDPKVIGLSILMAASTWAGRNLRGKGVSVSGVVGVLLITFSSINVNGHLDWNMFILALLTNLGSLIAPPAKNESYEQSPEIMGAKLNGLSAQDLMIKKYGMPGPAYEAKFCFLWRVRKDFPWFPHETIFINKDFKELLYKGFKNVEEKGLQGQIKTFDGCLVERPIRGSNKISMHAWGAAIDSDAVAGHMVIGVPKDKITDEMRRGPWTQEFIDCMTSAGVYFGGYFEERPDPMHWSMMDM